MVETLEENKEREGNHGETEQEKNLKLFLREHGIAFEQHKRVVGDGQKVWIVDFYLPEQGIIIEAKTINWLRQLNHGSQFGEGSIGNIYKDLYKIDELNRRYNLIGILYLKVPFFLFPKTFIPNLNAHNIFCITEPIQIVAILQKQKVEKINATFQPVISPAKNKDYIFADKELQLLYDWVNGKSIKELGLHAMQWHRKLRKYVKATLENKKLDAMVSDSGKDSATPN